MLEDKIAGEKELWNNKKMDGKKITNSNIHRFNEILEGLKKEINQNNKEIEKKE